MENLEQEKCTNISASTSDNSYTNFDIYTIFASNRPQTLTQQGRINVLSFVKLRFMDSKSS